jgi:two-component system, cell cycle sensor histidine kinase PleC
MSSPAVQSGSILIVDDDASMVDLASRTLQRAGYHQVEATTDAGRAVDLCRTCHPDVMLLDFHMPRLDGFAVMAAVQESDIETKPAVVMITGESDAAVRTMAYEHGARDFVTKPFDRKELLVRVANAVESVRLTRRLEAAVSERTAKLAEAVELLRLAERQLARQLERSEAESRSKSGLLAETMHEIRTPLGAILGYSEAVKAQLIGPIANARYLDYASHIHEAGLHLMKLVDDLLDLSRAELGEDRLDFAVADVGSIVRQMAGLLEIQAQAAGVSLEVRVDPGVMSVRTDATRLRQIILNLGANAVKYTPAKGQVTIEARREVAGGVIVLIVRDTGIGIAPAQIDLVMRPFGRTPEAKASGAIGTGIGLPLTRRYVEMLGGTLEIESLPRRGTIVTVKLPAVPAGSDRSALRG